MKTKLHSRFIMVCAGLLMLMGMSAQQTHLDIPIVDGNDDVEEWNTGEVNRGSSDLELYWDDGIQVIGILFRDVQLPTDAVIDSAYIQFISKTEASAAIDIQIYGVDSASVDSITGQDLAVSGKASTSETVAWVPEAWIQNPYPYSPTEIERTPELKTIINEITANAGWAAGNNMMFKLTGTVDENANRNAYAYEDEGDGSTGPHLHIYYSPKADDGIVYGGKTDKGPEANGNYYPWADYGAKFGLEFDALKDMKLLSVKVYNGTATGGDTETVGTEYVGERTISIINADEDTIISTTINVVPGEQRLNLNIVLPADSAYRLISDSHVGFWRDQSDPDELFPYAVGDIASITADLGFDRRNYNTSQYHFFYDWEVQAVSPNTTNLSDLISTSNTTIGAVTVGNAEGEYSQAKIDAANAAVAVAEDILANATSQAEVDQAITDLTAAMALFVPNEALDTDALAALIASSKTAIAAVTVGDAEGEYAQATVDAANAAITAAETTLASASTQAEVDQAITDLTAAMVLFVANGPNAIGSALNVNFRMYPNPAVDMLVLENISNVKNISILSVTGQRIKNISNVSNMLNIDLSDLSSGVYIIKFNATNGVSAKSFIKQ